jgi:MFS superfamily sulfate permease-like transporter
MYKKGKTVSIPFVVTVLGLIFTDLLVGICLGLVVGIMQILWNNYKMPYHFNPSTYRQGKPVVIKLSQEVTFLNKASIFRTLDEMPDGTHIIIDESNNNYIHPDIEEIFEEFAERAPKRDITFDRFNRDTVFDSDSEDKLKTIVQ